MKVKLHNRYAGPRGNFAADTVIEVPDKEGRALCEGNFATPVKCVGPKETATVEPTETAADQEPAPRHRDRGQRSKAR